MSQLRVVLLGILGHGKTFLFNKITLANEPVMYGGKSLTKQIVIGQAAYGQFEIVDTPGFEAGEDKVLHAAGVIAALAQGDVNRILIVVKCERTNIMIKNIKKIIGSIQRYRDSITIIVSYWDELQKAIFEKYQSIESQQKQEEEKKEIQLAKQEIELEIKKNFNICSVIFTSKPDDPKIITKMITEIILKSRLTKIQLQESEIYVQFDLLSLDIESESELEKSIKKINNGFKKITRSFLNYIKSLKLDDSNLIDKLHSLSLGIKRIANEFIEDFEKQHGDYMNETYDKDGINVRYLYHIYLKKELRLNVEKVIRKAQEKMKESQNHCFNWIKQCPYCGLVWIKVVGCNDETTCGNRVHSYFDDLLRKPLKENRYIIVVKNNYIDFEIEQEKKEQNLFANKQHYDIVQILIDSVKDDLIFSYNDFIFSDYDQKFKENHSNIEFHYQLIGIIEQYLYERFDYENQSNFQENMNEADLSLMINELKFILRENGLIKNQQNRLIQHQQKSFGCGRKIVWKDLPPLSGPLLEELLTPELIDYFNDQKQLLQDEADDISKELEKTYKDLMNQAINEQLKNIKVIQKQQSQMQNQNDTEKQEHELQQGKIKQNYQNLVENTKEKQNNIQRRYSIKMMTDPNLYSDTETIDTTKIKQYETQSQKVI